jgi:hypothetical protein
MRGNYGCGALIDLSAPIFRLSATCALDRNLHDMPCVAKTLRRPIAWHGMGIVRATNQYDLSGWVVLWWGAACSPLFSVSHLFPYLSMNLRSL